MDPEGDQTQRRNGGQKLLVQKSHATNSYSMYGYFDLAPALLIL